MDKSGLIRLLKEFIHHRLEFYFGKRADPPEAASFRIGDDDKESAGASVPGRLSIDGWSDTLTGREQLLLAIALAPHLDPELYSRLVRHFLPQGGDLPVFGGTRGKNHRGMIPTGETAQFILAGTNVAERLDVLKLFRESPLFQKGILALESVPDGEPEMSGKFVVSKESVELVLTGTVSTPAFGPDFPAQKIETGLAWDDLVMSDGVREQIEEIQTWIRYNDRLMKEWEMDRLLKPGYRVLFHGPPGTGKTLTATLMGRYTGRPVFRVDLSTIVSKYIGETEKNLEKLFTKAADKDWILFFDEADALFGKRTEVNDSHDRFANQEVSYLLQRVERFGGLVILSTNYKSNIDEAFLRRFNSIIKFPFPDAKQREEIWRRSFPPQVTYENQVDFSRIAASYKLSGGDIINAVHHAALREISRGSDQIGIESVLKGIRREIEKDGKVFKNLLADSTAGTPSGSSAGTGDRSGGSDDVDAMKQSAAKVTSDRSGSGNIEQPANGKKRK